MATVAVDLPEDIISDLKDLAHRKNISMTEALIESVTTTKTLADQAPNGATIVPLSKRAAARKATG